MTQFAFDYLPQITDELDRYGIAQSKFSGGLFHDRGRRHGTKDNANRIPRYYSEQGKDDEGNGNNDNDSLRNTS
jgi:hypothetical protein